jgi:hypothetical protein
VQALRQEDHQDRRLRQALEKPPLQIQVLSNF